jgi:hypothetical protein
MKSKEYKYEGKWITKSEIKKMINKKELKPIGKIGDATVLGICYTDCKNIIVEINGIVSILETKFNDFNGEHFVKIKTYYLNKMENANG